jgi:hypothetical protein
MSAQEVIEQIKSLPPAERRKVADFVAEPDFVESLVRELGPEHSGAPATAQRPDIDSLAEAIFDQYDELFRKLAQ